MICKQTQNTIDTLLRFKTEDSDSNSSNKIASIMSKPDYQRTKEEKEELTISVIEDIIQKGK